MREMCGEWEPAEIFVFTDQGMPVRVGSPAHIPPHDRRWILADELPHLPLQEERVAFARKLAGKTQIQLADLLGVSERTIQNYASGLHPIHVEHIPVLERLARLPRGWIAYGDTDGEAGSVGLGLVVKLAGFLAALGLLFTPTVGNASGPCHCARMPELRQQRFKLARRSGRSRPTDRATL
jgi:transcriptional regulator with XRE-family HTH domain